jgi:hypothetical protein
MMAPSFTPRAGEEAMGKKGALAGEQALSNLPWLIRAPVKKIVGDMS